MREALQEARNYRDPTNEGGPGSGPQKGGKKFSDKEIKQAYGILNDPRYKQGNYSGASKAIDKLAPGLSNHPDVKNAMKRANEEIEESLTKIGDFEYALRVHMVNNLGLSADAAANKIKKYKHLINKSMGVVHTAGMLLRKEDLDEAAFSQTQIDALKQKYSGLRGSEKNGIQMDKLAKIMKRYPKDHLNQLAKLDIPMVSKVAKAMTEEVAEGGPGSGPQKGGGTSGKGDYKKSSKAAMSLKKPKKSGQKDPLKIPGASQHQKSGKNVRMNKVPKKFGGEYYDQEDREELAHRVKFHHLGGKSQAGKPPEHQLRRYGINPNGELKRGWKPDDQL